MKIDDFLSSPFTFTKRKVFIPCELRVVWRACLIILIIGIAGKNKSSSLKKIHVASWLIKSAEHFSSFMDWSGKAERKRPDVRLDPYVDKILTILVSNKILIKSEKYLTLTDSGIEIFNEINESHVYVIEKQYLSSVERLLSEASVKRIFEGV